MAEKKSTQSHVTVACKIAVAWFDLRICEPKEISENTQTGARKVTQWFPTGEVIRVRGTAYPRGEAPEGFPERPEMLMGYALTRGIPKDKWDKYLEANAKAPFIKSGMLRAFESTDQLKGYAEEHKDEMSGLEPIQRKKKQITDPRVPKSTNGAVMDLQPDDRVRPGA